ncbi:MAG: acyl-CoA thioesterase, partial [Brooklawnia sp.]
PLPDDLRLHQAVLAYISDLTLLSVSAVPHPVVFMSNQLQTASVDHVMWFHRDFRADDWLLYDMFSPSASAALGYSSGRLFQDGRLVVSCAQEGLIRPVGERQFLS